MSLLPDRDSVNKRDLAVLGLYSISYLLGIISFYILNTFPATTGPVTIYKIILGAASTLAIAGILGGIFLLLTRIFVLDPLRDDLDAATTTAEGGEDTGSGGSSEQETIPIEVLGYLGYTNTVDDNDTSPENDPSNNNSTDDNL